MAKRKTTGGEAAGNQIDVKAAILTPVFRVSWPELFKAVSYEGGEAKFSVHMIFGEKAQANTRFADMKTLATAQRQATFGDNPPAKLRSPFRDGEEKPDTDGYGKGIIFTKASSLRPPEILDENGQPLLAERDLYAGCFARAYVVTYGYDKKGNKGVAFGLRSIRKVADGPAFGGGGSFADAYGDVDEDELPEGATTGGAAAPADGDNW